MKYIVLKVNGDYYVENGNPMVLGLTRSLLAATLFKGRKRIEIATRKIRSFDLDFNRVILEITPQ